MTRYYCYLLPLLIVFLSTHWSSPASLRLSSSWPWSRRNHSSIVASDYTTVEPILSRRRPMLPSEDRQRRWATGPDNDEVEISVDGTIIKQALSPTIESNSNATYNQSDDSSLAPSIADTTVVTEAIDTKPPLLRENSTESSQSVELTTSADLSPQNSTAQGTDSSDDDSTSASIQSTQAMTNFPTNATDADDTTIAAVTDVQTTIDESPSTVSPTSTEEISNSSSTNTTNYESLLDSTTSSYNITADNETFVDSTVFEDFNSTLSENESSASTNTTLIEDEIDVTQTSTIVDEEYSNETLPIPTEIQPVPICDQSCQCGRKCPYGFEIIDDQCKCDPPCKKYQCFGNDTCVITSEGKPICQPSNDTVHDRPMRCYQPRDDGYHDDTLRYHNRWYYNPDQDTCHLFVYRGLGGNENNFLSLNECHLECITCAPAPDRGTCLGYIRMWYYDGKTSQCSEFEYSGCKGNDNKFFQKQDCIDTCVTRILNL